MDHDHTGILAVIVAHNECRSVKINVRILLDELAGTGSEIVVVDNYSNDGLQEWLSAQRAISSIICDNMQGYGTILSVVLREFKDHRDLLLLRANCFLTPGSIAALKETLDAQEEIAAAAPVGNLLAGEQKCSEAATYQEACRYSSGQAKSFVKTAYLDADVMLLKRDTALYIRENAQIPLAAMREYRREVLKRSGSFAVVKNAVCFSVCAANEEAYRTFAPEVHKKEQLLRLLYRFGDLTYEGVHLYKYLEPDIVNGIYQQKKLHNTVRDRSIYMWQSEQPVRSSREEAQAAEKMLETLPQKEVLFVTLFLRRMYQGRFEHTAIEPFIESIGEEKYLDLEFVSDVAAQESFQIPTKNRYAMLISAVPAIYGIQDTDRQRISDYLWENIIHPLEQVLQIQFPLDFLKGCLSKVVYILKERSGFLKFYRNVIEKVKPKVILYSHGQDRLLDYLRDAALEAGIPTLEIAHGVTVLGAYHKHLAYADKVVAFSSMIAEKSRLSGNPYVLGIGKPDVYKNQKIYQKDHIKIMIAFISSLEGELFTYAKNLADRLDKQKYQIIYKMHSAELWTDQEIQTIESMCINLKFAGGNMDIRDLAGMSDIAVGICSTGIFDMLPYPMVKVIAVRDKAEYDLPNTLAEIIQETADRGELVIAEDETQLYEEVMDYERGTQYRKVPGSFWPDDAGEKFQELVYSYL